MNHISMNNFSQEQQMVLSKGLMLPVIQQQQPVQLVEENMSNLTSASGEASVSSNQQSFASPNSNTVSNPNLNQHMNPAKKKRNLPGNPDPEAEVIALSPRTLMATNRFICEICNKGFQRDQNLQLHRRGHNLPWKLKQRNPKEPLRKKVYICPEISCVHHDPSRALGDLTGIKKHFSRKHGEKKWKCEKCSKKYAVQSDWKAHSKICGTREYRCDCGTLFSRRDSFITHRAFCDALAEESARAIATSSLPNQSHAGTSSLPPFFQSHPQLSDLPTFAPLQQDFKREQHNIPSWLTYQFDQPVPVSSPVVFSAGPSVSLSTSCHMSATALLQKAAQMGATLGKPNSYQMAGLSSGSGFGLGLGSNNQTLIQDTMGSGNSNIEGGLNGGDGMTRDFLGLRGFTHREFLNMAGLNQCMNNNNSNNSANYEHNQRNKKPWLG
ncbi:hypothetical protein LUZ60_009307 [Juncus effusus]|nr:hypothetical protein LUZ60_009307 [Juncus effusus]